MKIVLKPIQLSPIDRIEKNEEVIRAIIEAQTKGVDEILEEMRRAILDGPNMPETRNELWEIIKTTRTPQKIVPLSPEELVKCSVSK